LGDSIFAKARTYHYGCPASPTAATITRPKHFANGGDMAIDFGQFDVRLDIKKNTAFTFSPS